MRTVFLSLVLGFFLGSCSQAQQHNAPKSGVVNLGPTEFIQKVKATASPQLLDVRSPEEWAEGKVAASHCVQHDDPAFREKVATLDKSKPVFVYCRSGGRSPIAAKALQALGFQEVYNLNGGGCDDLRKAGIQ